MNAHGNFKKKLWPWCLTLKDDLDFGSKERVLPQGIYSITYIQRPLKGSNEFNLLQQVVFKYRFYLVDLRRVFVSEKWSLKAGGL